MVVAEVPLCVVHAAGGGNIRTTAATAAEGGETSKDGQSTSTSQAVGQQQQKQHQQQSLSDRQQQRALESLSLLESSGGSHTASNGNKAAAIYSVDVSICGTKFATGGGDGTVKIWNTGALFLKASAGGASTAGASSSEARIGRYKKEPRVPNGTNNNKGDEIRAATSLARNTSHNERRG